MRYNGSLPCDTKPFREDGVVMVVALIMLLLITLVTFAVMETSSLEAQMATAAEQKAITFQMAEGAVSEASNDFGNLGAALRAKIVNEANPDWPTGTHALTGYDSDDRIVTAAASSMTEYIGNTATMGYSVRKGSAGIDTYYYEVEATSTIANSMISNVHTQGVYVEAPRAQ
ncbi:pilus assembly PilX family protein [Candidatus Marimicrobium litorale]|uniref:Type 4 fimbrial biogenesis protein PilX N-terminal domain-containing protein n=1 Tax=Candidatus Marimicrobium litorale TaxID=2518991 RepID=A0ABT3TBC2_9GAMM|nr:PilX N-terminal domain-containing pilus assembly protein [Candidatus Marimicrobium litorale]MCX2979145.1 hypothetical protein [Candidatus Marimicrobium litorale]